MSWFGKSYLINKDIHSNEILNMKLNIWIDIVSKYMEDSCVIFYVTVCTFSERLTDTSCQDFLVFSRSLVRWYEKCLTEEYFRAGLPFFFFFYFSFNSYVPFGFCLKRKVVHCVRSFWLICVILRSYMLMLNTLEF